MTPGQRVLDVACGTGVVAREAAQRVGASGRVVAVDINEAMLSVARRLSADVDWQTADACRLPFPTKSPELYVLLVTERGWTPARYRRGSPTPGPESAYQAADRDDAVNYDSIRRQAVQAHLAEITSS